MEMPCSGVYSARLYKGFGQEQLRHPKLFKRAPNPVMVQAISWQPATENDIS